MTSTAIATRKAPRHVKVTGRLPMFGYERCADEGCVVDGEGIATSCRHRACPRCGSSGTNLTRSIAPGGNSRSEHLRCTCGHAWVVTGDGHRSSDH